MPNAHSANGSNRKRRWVGKWIRSERFWRDVASQALGGLVVLAAGAIAATAAGLLSSEQAAALGRGFAGFLLFAGSLGLVHLAFLRALRWGRRRDDWSVRRFTVYAVGVLAVQIGVSVGLLYLWLRAIGLF